MPRGDISCEARKGEGGSLPRTNYITGTCLKVFLRLVSPRHFFFLLYKMPSLPFQRQRIENEGPTFRFKNKDGLREMAPISIPRGSSIPHTTYTDQITVVLHQLFYASLCLLVVLLKASWPFKLKLVSLQINC